jgi:hypothetical protein
MSKRSMASITMSALPGHAHIKPSSGQQQWLWCVYTNPYHLLLDVDFSNNVIVLLATNADDSGLCAASSYCRGNSLHNYTTTQLSLNDRKNDIRLSALPKTFQDAVAVVRRLQIRYFGSIVCLFFKMTLTTGLASPVA